MAARSEDTSTQMAASLDLAANTIGVSVDQNRMKLRYADDGSGMSAADCEICHADLTDAERRNLVGPFGTGAIHVYLRPCLTKSSQTVSKKGS